MVPLVKGALSIADLIRATSEMSDLIVTNQVSDNMCISAANQALMAATIITEMGMNIAGASSQKKLWIKNCEVFTRVIDLLAKPMMAEEKNPHADPYQKSAAQFQATLSAMASLCKALAESGYYSEGTYLEMSPEELKNAKRRKVDPEGTPTYSMYTGPSGTPQLIVHPAMKDVPVDLEECKNLQNGYSEISDLSAITRAVSGLVQTFTQELYSNLRQALNHHYHPQANNQPAPPPANNPPQVNNQPVPQAAPQIPVEVNLEGDELILTNLNFIPAPLHNDVVFKKYICPITGMPIRRVVCDPNGVTLYERSAIRTALSFNPVSPVTRRPLLARQLLERPAIQAEINARLNFHQQGLEAFLQQNQNAPV